MILQVPPSNGHSAFDAQELCTLLHSPRGVQSPATRHAVPLTWQVPCSGAQSALTLQAKLLTLHCLVPGHSALELHAPPVTLQLPGGQT